MSTLCFPSILGGITLIILVWSTGSYSGQASGRTCLSWDRYAETLQVSDEEQRKVNLAREIRICTAADMMQVTAVSCCDRGDNHWWQHLPTPHKPVTHRTLALQSQLYTRTTIRFAVIVGRRSDWHAAVSQKALYEYEYKSRKKIPMGYVLFWIVRSRIAFL